MKVSYNWLQTYFKEALPSVKEITELFTFHSFEVEGEEKIGGDTMIDVKILPDRAHYALCHRGIARELSLVFQHELIQPTYNVSTEKTRPLSIRVEDTLFCPRYTGRVIENITIGESDDVVKGFFSTIGARAINTVVDATNFVMFDMGQPLHAFDADKVKGDIVVRHAKEGEKIVVLDGKEITLSSEDVVIADDEGALAIAGVKGGKRAEVTTSTKNIILEAANFNATAVRRTSTRVGIRNDSSKRFENAITPEWTKDALLQVSSLITKFSPQARVGEIVDVYPHKTQQTTLHVPLHIINARLGVEVPREIIIDILKRLTLTVREHKDTLELTIPYERLDLTIPEDIVEEVGRIYGYDKIPATLPPRVSHESLINKTFYYTEKIKNILRDEGAFEVYLYSLTKNGHHEVAYPLASDKSHLRTNLREGMERALTLNTNYVAVLRLEKVTMFEIGKVFTKEKEHTSLAIGSRFTRKFKGETVDAYVESLVQKLSTQLGVTLQAKAKDGIVEIDLDTLIDPLPSPKTWDIAHEAVTDVTFKALSPYPYIVRDIALFVPNGTEPKSVYELILSVANESRLLQTMYLFDQFDNGSGKISLAYRLVFQSHERTLEDKEANAIMEKIYAVVKEKGYEVR